MNDAKYRGPNGLTPKEALDSVPDNMGEAARDLLAAELYGTDYGDFISALGDQILTDKERARVLREEADNIEGSTTCAEYAVSRMRERANELDPPEPEIPDGHVWYRYYGKTPQDWSPGLKFEATILNQYGQRLDGPRLEVIPAHALEPGQVAVDRHAIVEARSLLRFDEHIFTANKLQDALDRDTGAQR